MKNYEAMGWGQLSSEEQEKFLRVAYVDKDRIDEKTGGCLVHFENGLSCIGTIRKDGEKIIIDIGKEAKLYKDPLITADNFL